MYRSSIEVMVVFNGLQLLKTAFLLSAAILRQTFGEKNVRKFVRNCMKVTGISYYTIMST